jgi:NitT/TauT family transport system ATP-binding protein
MRELMTTPAHDTARGARVNIDAVAHTFPAKRGPVVVFDEVNCELEPGEFIAILGPSGCGKSTLLRIVAGLIKPSQGRVAIDDQRVERPSRGVGMVFQEDGLLEWRTIFENVMLPAEIKGIPKSSVEGRAHVLLEQVGLSEFEDARPSHLSGGMKQRAAICQALVYEPRLLLMDEPFGALDALTREQMRIDLEKLWLSRRQTTLFITHGISEAVALADRVMVMTPRPGRIDRIIEIDLPRPRDKAVVTSPRFTHYCDEITECFMRHGVIQY